MFVRFFVAAWLMLLAATVDAATYYVSTSGDDSRSSATAQNINTPWRTLTASVPKLACGDTLNVRGGTYTTEGGISFVGKLCTSGTRLTVTNYQNEAVDISCPNETCKILVGTSGNRVAYITVNGLEIHHGGGVDMLCDSCILDHLNIHHNGENGVFPFGTNWTIRNSRIWHNGDIGPECQGGATSGCNLDHGIYGGGGPAYIYNNLIYDNQAYAIQLAGYTCTVGAADCPTSAYSGVHDWFIANNVLGYEQNRAGIVFWAAGGSINAPTVINNIFYFNCVRPAMGCSSVEIAIDNSLQTTPNAIIKNNIMYGNGTGSALYGVGGSICGNFTGSQCSCTNCTVTGNIFSQNPNFTTAPSQPLNNNPAALPSNLNFHLTSSSTIALNAGLNLTPCGIAGLATDFDGSARPSGGTGSCSSPTSTGWEIGAYEFGVTPDTTPPAAPTGLQVQ